MKDNNFEEKANLYTSVAIFNKCPYCKANLTYFQTLGKKYCIEHGAMI